MTLRYPCRGRRQGGLTIVELMISITLGLFIVLAASALLLSAKASYITQDEGARVQETGRYALEVLARAVRQTGYENWDQDTAAILNVPGLSASLSGLDARSLKEADHGIDVPVAKSVNGSDVLAIRFIGSGASPNGDGTMLNCAGFSVPAPASLEADRGWSIFYVANDKNGEPELRCKYDGKTSWNSEAIASGVESFQVLYGIDTDGDGLPNRYLTATNISDLDDELILDGPNAVARALDRNIKTNWKKVVVIKVALLVRSAVRTQGNAPANLYDLFGKDYADMHAANDIGTRISESSMAATQRNRFRKVFALTIQLRNRSAGSGT
jgi:type IV pilus assembly protein PilW